MLKLTDEQKQIAKHNRNLPTNEVLGLLPDDIKPFAFIVGVWVWLQFERKPDPETIKTVKLLGFLWNRKRRAWQHACGVYVPHSSTDPRYKYGMVSVESGKEVALA